MYSLTVHLEVPEFIETALGSGSMERVGGVIRYTDSKQIVAWLREGGKIGDDLVLRSGLLDDVLRAVGTTATTAAKILGKVFPILDIALASDFLLEMIDEIDSHRQEMELVYERIEEEFRQDRLANLVTALKIARNLAAVKDPEYKRLMVGQVTDRLLEAREHLRVDFNELVACDMKPQEAEQAMRYMILSMQVATMIVRAWLEIGEVDLALEWLCGILGGQKERTRIFVNTQLGDLRALYFHESVSDEDFDRFINVERWLRGKRVVLPEIVKEHRNEFWKDDTLVDLFSGGLNSYHIEPPFYEKSLENAELLIENYQRLEGYELELKSMCLPFPEWDSYEGDDRVSIVQHDDFVMIVNSALFDDSE